MRQNEGQCHREGFDYTLGNWVTRYDITQAYDKNGNRTGYHKNVAAGYTSSYGKAYNLSYTFDSVNALTAITDGDDANYSCAVVSDANLNITQLTESDTRTGSGVLYTYFDYDALNRLGAHRTKRNTSAAPLPATWVWTKRSHQYDATGRLVKSNWKTWIDGTSEPSGDSLEHIYAGAKHVQNYDGTNYGAVWHWAGAEHAHMGPLNSPNADTASQQGYNLAVGGADVAAGAGGPAGGAGGMEPQRRTVLTPTSEGDQRNLFGQGRPMAKDSSGSGSAWATGTVSQPTGARGYAVESRLMFDGTVAATDMSRATDAREKDRIGIFGTGLSYAGSYGRVTSESIGRDLNPLGRGNGQALMGGMMNLGILTTTAPTNYLTSSFGNSINNGCSNSSSFVGPTAAYNPAVFNSSGCKNCCSIPFDMCRIVLENNPCICDPLAIAFHDNCCGKNANMHYGACNSLYCEYLKCLPTNCSNNPKDPLYPCPSTGGVPWWQLEDECLCNLKDPSILDGIESSPGTTNCTPKIEFGITCTFMTQANKRTVEMAVRNGLKEVIECKGKGCMPGKAIACLRNYCSGIQTIKINCGGNLFECKSPGVLAYQGMGGIVICTNGFSAGYGRLIYILIHEFLHICDPNRNSHKSPASLCYASTGQNLLNEGFANACAEACTNTFVTGHLRQTRTNMCCRCRLCAE